ncbi:hypothetical protein [Vibrio sp. OPT24]|uniref:hypothetical protein n=1 Tax=Vibrio sp. OPT24 TaxID=2778643 RepID=UPI00187F8593|nr:hypothetical protein [Vibrio sp. OPT24]MBE8557183.1 hypothetical protein [Vibrio sp. OPT24]
MNPDSFILVLGSVDRLSKNIISYMNINKHPYLMLNEKTVNTIKDIPCGQSLNDFNIEYLDGKKISFSNCTGILVNHFSVPLNSGVNEERFWSEWNAFFGGAILSSHNNVLNPPSSGSWCGEFPTIFRQIELLESSKIGNIIFPSVEKYFEFSFGNGIFKKNMINEAFYIPCEYWEAVFYEELKHETILEASCCFVDDEFIFEGVQFDETKRILEKLASSFAKKTNSRIGEIGVFIIGGKHCFRYALTRPILNSFTGIRRYEIVEKIYAALVNEKGIMI